MLFRQTIAFKNFDLPITISCDYDYYEKLRDILEQYSNEVSSIPNLPKQVIINTQHNIELILDSINKYYNAEVTKATYNISTLLQKYINSPFFVATANMNYAFRGLLPYQESPNFYRARKGNTEFKRNDFLHIPLNNRGKIATQRFSIPGIPCIYLGTTSYVCWLELDKPADNELTVSSFTIPDNLKVLNLALTQHLINGHSGSLEDNDPLNPEVKKLFDMIEIFPLICATSFRVKELNRVFKSEYIISHLLMQNLSSFEIDGVAYISKKVRNDSLSFPQAVNLALPIKNTTKSDVYGDLCSNLTLTQPINFAEYIKIENKTSNRCTSLVNSFDEGYTASVEFAGKTVRYQDLPFSKYDDYLLSLPFNKPI